MVKLMSFLSVLCGLFAYIHDDINNAIVFFVMAIWIIVFDQISWR